MVSGAEESNQIKVFRPRGVVKMEINRHIMPLKTIYQAWNEKEPKTLIRQSDGVSVS